MSAKVHYEDDLYYLHALIRHMESSLRLELDQELFWDKLLEDIFFIDATLHRLYTSLKDNTFLLHRIEFLRSLRRTDIAFQGFLQHLQEQRHTFSKNLETFREKVSQTRNSHGKMHEEIDALLLSIEPAEETTDIVSSEEIDILLAGSEEGEDEE